MGEAAKPYIKDILNFLKDKTVEDFVRSGAAVALGNLGEAAKPYVKDIANILKDKTVSPWIRSGAAEALGDLGEAAKPYVKDITDILKDKSVDSTVRYGVTEGLGNLGEAAKPYVKDILDFLKDKTLDFYPRSSTAYALGKIEQLNLNNIVVILDIVYYAGQSEFEEWRFLTYFLSGGTDEVETLLTWLARSEKKAIPEQLTHDEGKKTLEVFLKAWEPSKDLERLREDLAEQISIVAENKKVHCNGKILVCYNPTTRTSKLCTRIKLMRCSHR